MNFPVFKALAATFAYLAQCFVDLIKALWLPALLFFAAQIFVAPGYYDAVIDVTRLGDNPDPAEAAALAGSMFSSMGLMLLVTAIFYPMLIVASLRHVVRGDTLTMPLYIGFGGDELRVLGGYILLVIMVGLAFGVGMLAVTVLMVALAAAAQGAGAAIGGLVMIAFLVAMVWFLTRMSVIFPAAIDTRTFGLAQSWGATKGSAISLFFFWLVIVVLFAVIGVVYSLLAMPSLLSFYGEMIRAGADQAAQNEVSIRMMEAQRDMMDPSNAKFWPYAISTYVMTVVSMAVMGASGGVAWRYLSSSEERPI